MKQASGLQDVWKVRLKELLLCAEAICVTHAVFFM